MNPADIIIGTAIAAAVAGLCIRAYKKNKRGEPG